MASNATNDEIQRLEEKFAAQDEQFEKEPEGNPVDRTLTPFQGFASGAAATPRTIAGQPYDEALGE